MAQKINPTIFRLGFNKTWKTEFFEKKKDELPLYLFKDIEMKNYIERVLEVYGIILHDYKHYHNNSTLNLYIAYFITSDFSLDKKNINEKITIRNVVNEIKTVKFLNDVKRPTYFPLNKKTNNPYKIKQYLKLVSSQNFLAQPQKFSTFQKKNFAKFSSTLKSGIFLEIFKVLNSFNNNKLNIVLNFCCVNKDLHFLKTTQKKIFKSLQKFRNTSFFKEGGVELLFHVVYNSNSANLLAKFIVSQLEKIKRQKFFFSFLNQTLTVLLNSNLSQVKGVKMIVRGRLNGAPRAKQKIIIIGDIPVQSISTKLDYSQATAHNSNGSYGIKIWVVEK